MIKRQEISSEQIFFFAFQALQVPSRNISPSLILWLEYSISKNIRKAFFWEIIRKFCFSKYKNSFFMREYNKFVQGGFF